MCIVGDRVLSDVLMGNKFGTFTILVKPFTSAPENPVVKILRKFENGPIHFLIKKEYRDVIR